MVARLDNLTSTWAGIASIAEISNDLISKSSDIMVAIAWDNEEVGSVSYIGANSSILERWLHQVLFGLFQDSGNSEVFSQVIAKSFLLSTDG